jgi:outer membrane protein assembly factor BamB
MGGPTQLSELTIFQYVRQDGLYAVNLANGKVRWKMPEGRKVVAIMKGTVYVLDKNKNLRMVNEITGKGDRYVPLSGFQHYAANVKAPAVYVATDDGEVFCIRKKDAGRLTAEMLRQ